MNAPTLLLMGMLAATSLQARDDVEKVSLRPVLDMNRADLYVWKPIKRPVAILVLSPGCNGNGEGLIRQKAWQDFAAENKLGLAGLSFASDVSLLTSGRGYYYASQGSGDVLLDGLKEAFGKDLPLLLYGFSGGAHFSSRFAEWKPERVLSWCAYSAGWWDEPKKTAICPPGIVVCGDRDERYGASIIYFKQGRAAGKPWLWVSVGDNGHSPHAPVEAFVREYFRRLLQGDADPVQDGLWVDVDRLVPVDPAREHPALTAWLPEERLFNAWKEVHKP